MDQSTNQTAICFIGFALFASLSIRSEAFVTPSVPTCGQLSSSVAEHMSICIELSEHCLLMAPRGFQVRHES